MKEIKDKLECSRELKNILDNDKELIERKISKKKSEVNYLIKFYKKESIYNLSYNLDFK